LLTAFSVLTLISLWAAKIYIQKFEKGLMNLYHELKTRAYPHIFFRSKSICRSLPLTNKTKYGSEFEKRFEARLAYGKSHLKR